MGKKMYTNSSATTQNSYMSRVLVKDSKKNVFVDVSDIHWIECSGNYLKLHLPETTHMIRSSLKNLQSKLDPYKFVRIHRSWMVNIHEVEEIEPWYSGDFKVVLHSGKELRMSRNYKDNLERFTLN